MGGPSNSAASEGKAGRLSLSAVGKRISRLVAVDPESVQIGDEDLFLVYKTGLFANGLILGSVGLVLSLGIVVGLGGVFGWVTASLLTAGFVLTGVLRNRLLQLQARRGFRPTFKFQRFVHSTFIVGLGLAVFVVAFGSRLPASVSLLLYVPFLFSFTYYYPYFTVFSSKERESKFLVLQFLKGLQNGKPEYIWLRRALGRVEGKVASLGLSIPRNRLFFGCSYAIFHKIPVESDLAPLGNWLDEARGVEITPSITSLLAYARRAEKSQYQVTSTFLERVGRFPWQQASAALTVVLSVVAVLGIVLAAVLALLRYANIQLF